QNAGVRTNVGAAERLVEMEPADIPAEIPMGVQDTVDICDPFPLTAQVGVGIQEVPRIAHNPFLPIMDCLQSIGSLLRISHGKPRPPMVLQQELKCPRLAGQQVVDDACRRVNHLPVGVFPLIGVRLLNGYIRHMENDITDAQRLGPGQVVPVKLYQVRWPPTAVKAAGSIQASKFPDQCRLVLSEKIQPVRLESQVVSHRKAAGKTFWDFRSTPDRLNAVAA